MGEQGLLGPASLVAIADCLGSRTSEGYDNNDVELSVRQKDKETCSSRFDGRTGCVLDD